MNYLKSSLLPSSEKISLVTFEAVKPVKLFDLHLGVIYKKKVDYFVIGIKKGGIDLTQGTNKNTLNVNEFYYDPLEKIFYLNVNQDPKNFNISIVYKLFFSNAPVIFPYDLQNGTMVEFLPYIKNISSIGQQLDSENSGIVLESESSIEFINSDGLFDSIIDTLILENQNISFYSLFNNLPITEAKKIFDGVIESKKFSTDTVSFKVKDYVYKLRNFVNLGLFSELDGKILESINGTPKRRIYGQAKQAQCIPVDCILDGYDLTGTITLVNGSNIMSGTGTFFLKELNQNDEIVLIFNNEQIIYSIDLVLSETSARLSKDSEQDVLDISVKVDPEYPYRFKNRKWHVAGHKIRQSIATITNVINARTFVVDDNSEFLPGDTVRVLGITTQVTRKSGNEIILEQNIFPIPPAGTFIVRFPISKLFFGEKELLPFRDFSLLNNDEAIIELSNLAEFNIARELVTNHNLSFNHNSYQVSSNASSDLRTIIKPGDFIRSTVQNNENWYEVHHVDAQTVWLKTVFSNGGSNSNHPARVKKLEVVNDDSLILVDCYGKDLNDKWLKTASDCVKDLVVNDAGFLNINDETFDQANIDCSYTMSLVFPDVGGTAPQIRDIITLINESVFGSLYGNSTQDICFSIVNTRRNLSSIYIEEDDIISWNVDTTQSIVDRVKINYQPLVDKVTGENAFSVVVYENDFVKENLEIKNIAEKVCYLFYEDDALTIAQRYAFFNSLSRSVITLNAKANFFQNSVNDRIYLKLPRMFKRYGGSSNLKMGIISGIKKGQYDSEIEVNDLGNIFNRCPAIGNNSLPTFTNSSDDEKIKFGYILDSDTLIPGNDESDLGSGLIG